MKSSTTPDFWVAYQVLPERVRNLARKTYRLWQENRGIHLCTGNSSRLVCGQSAFGLQYRALARVRGDTAYWFWIGSHNEFDNIISRFISQR
jgi:hypothetical protein